MILDATTAAKQIVRDTIHAKLYNDALKKEIIMTMKKFELEKRKAEKLHNDLGAANAPARFGQAAGAMLDKKEQRKLDQAQGLVPFACKLNQDLVKQLHAACTARNVSVNELVAELIQAGLSK